MPAHQEGVPIVSRSPVTRGFSRSEESGVPNDKTSTAWHVAGHAFMAMGYGFYVEKLSLEGFSQTGTIDRHERAQRLDEWTMIRLPEKLHPPGSFLHAQFMERLCHIALAGPIRDLIHQGQSCSLDAVQQHADDWRQAWTAAGHLWSDEAERLQFLAREIQRGEAFLGMTFTNEFTSPVVRRLLDEGRMTAAEVREIWDEAEAAKERRLSRPYRKRRCLPDDDDCESLFFEINDEAQP